MKKEIKRTTFKLFYNRLCKLSILQKAWSSVYLNGIQSDSTQAQKLIADYKKKENVNLNNLQKKLKNNIFQPAGSGKPIAKSEKGKYRPIVAFDIDTRIVQRAILDILQSHNGITPYLNCPTSFGGIKNKGVSDAIEYIFRKIREGYSYYIKTDIKSFFTSIPIDEVIKKIQFFCKDDKFIKLLSSVMKIEVKNIDNLKRNYPDIYEQYIYTEAGVPQGSCLSPLFGNIYLNILDKELNIDKDVVCCRYIDDVILIGKSNFKIDSIYNNKFLPMLSDLNLEAYKPHSSKFDQGCITSLRGVDYLGVYISFSEIKPSKDAFKKIEKEIINLLAEGLNFEPLKKRSLYEILDLISKKLKGWANHYWFCNASRELKGLDQKISRRIVCFVKEYNKRLLALENYDKIREALGILFVQKCSTKNSIIDKIKSEKK